MPKYNNTKLHTLIYNWQAWDWHLIFIPGTYKNTMIEAYQLSPTTVRNFKMQIDYQWTEEVRNCKMQFPTYGTLHIYNNNCILWSTGFNLTLFLGLPPNRSKVGEQNALDELILGNYSLKYCMQWSGEVNQMNRPSNKWRRSCKMEKKTLLHAERDKKSARSGVLMAISITIKQK